MKTIEELLEMPIKYKPGFSYLDYVHESYRGVNRNIYTNDDINEAIHTAAGIDDYVMQ